MNSVVFSIEALTTAGSAAFGQAAAGELGRGAIAGGMVLAVALLAGLSILGRTATAVCALLVASAGAALLFISLGLAPQPSPIVLGVFQSVFAASALIYVSSSVAAARDNPLLGSLMFAGAISVVGIAVINIVREGQAAGLLQSSAVAAGAAAIAVAIYGAAKGEAGARLIAPGGAIALAAPVLGPMVGGAVATQALFAAGVGSAAILGALHAAMAKAGAVNMRLPRRAVDHRGHHHVGHGHHNHQHAHFPSAAPARAGGLGRDQSNLGENQLAQVLDYTGVAVWDWSDRAARQTESFCEIMGAGCEGDFTPDAMLEFIKPEDRPTFETEVLGRDGEDGSFDRAVGLVTGKTVRMRGARAVDANGDLERVIVFVEEMGEVADRHAHLLRNAATSLTGAAALGAGRTAPLSVSPSEVSQALADGALAAGFQPIVALRDGSTVGYEALVRWPEREKSKNAPPAEDVIRAAELAGEGDALARRMITAAAAKIAGERDARKAKTFCSVNVTVGQALALGFVETVKNAIETHQLAPKTLVLELTEVERIDDSAAVASAFAALQEAGAALAFDDFGAGFSSLGNLHKFAFDYLKIDRSFIEKLVGEPGAEKTVAALARLGREFGMTVIAEGVETKKTADAARAAGCAWAQGFLYGDVAVGAPLTQGSAGAASDEGPGDADGAAVASTPAMEMDGLSDERAAGDDVEDESARSGGGPVYGEPTPANDVGATSREGGSSAGDGVERQAGKTSDGIDADAGDASDEDASKKASPKDGDRAAEKEPRRRLFGGRR